MNEWSMRVYSYEGKLASEKELEPLKSSEDTQSFHCEGLYARVPLEYVSFCTKGL